MTIAFPLETPTLTGEAIHLRALAEADIPAWFARATDAEAADLAGDPIATSIDQGREWLARHRQRFRDQTALRWAIVANGAAESVGTIGLILAAAPAELGLTIGRAHWNRGFATEAASLVLAYAAAHLGLTEIQAEILDRNHASRHLFARLGFTPHRRVPDEDPFTLYRLQIG